MIFPEKPSVDAQQFGFENEEEDEEPITDEVGYL